MDYFEIPNWHEYQHYTKRNPPWVKLHIALMSSETWVMLDDASRVLAVACIMIAARNDGKVPADPKYAQRVAYLNTPPDFKPLVDTGFLVDASGVLARCTQDASAMLDRAEQSRGEKSREEQSVSIRGRMDVPAGFDDWYQHYPRKSARKDAEKAWRSLSPGADMQARIIEDTKRRAKCEDWTKERGKYCPLPATYLRGARWEDECLVVPAAATVPDYMRGAL